MYCMYIDNSFHIMNKLIPRSKREEITKREREREILWNMSSAEEIEEDLD